MNFNAVILKWTFFFSKTNNKSHLETTFDSDNLLDKETKLCDSRKVIKLWQVCADVLAT